jgi:hypothetical protein
MVQHDAFHVAWWLVAPDHEGVGLWAESVTRHLKAQEGAALVCNVVDEHCPPPRVDARGAIAKVLEACSNQRGVVPAVIILGGGFKAVAQRTSLAAVSLLAKTARNVVVADEPATLAPKLPTELQARRLSFDAVFAKAMQEAECIRGAKQKTA